MSEPKIRLRDKTGKPLGKPLGAFGWWYSGGELLDAVPVPGDWGPWTLDTEALVLTTPDGYEVDLGRCLTSAQLLDHVMQVAGKRHADDRVTAGLVRALGDILHPQANLCSSGASKRITVAKVRELAAKAEAERAEGFAVYPGLSHAVQQPGPREFGLTADDLRAVADRLYDDGDPRLDPMNEVSARFGRIRSRLRSMADSVDVT